MEQPWYHKVDSEESPLLQGDIVFDCPIVRPPEKIPEGDETVMLKVDYFDVVILSQSCDLDQGNVNYVLVCPISDFQEIVKGFKQGDQKWDRIQNRFKNIRSGMQPGYHMLDKDPESGIDDFKVADLRSVYGIHIDSLKAHISSGASRIRLLSPYREHLAQAFARFMMRVGLPQSIPDLGTDQARAYADGCK